MTDLYRLLPEEMEEMIIELGQPRYRADQILYALYYKFPKSISEIKQLPSIFRETLVEKGFAIGSTKEVHRVVSKDGETTKLLLNLQDETPVESVLMQYPPKKMFGHPRSTICVSTQVGCAMGCVFCATGQMGFERNMKAEEIVGQVIHFAKILSDKKQHVTNIVFMGMGEPLANYSETIRAIQLLTHPRGFGLGQRNITISTIGIISAIDKLSEENLQVGLAISLHAPNDKLRQWLVPTAGKESVKELIDAGKRFFLKTGRRVTFEYALIKGVNDSIKIAEELALLLRNNGSHVNIIPLNPTAGELKRPSRNNVIEFERILYNSGINCTVRVEKGTEISAACGQLRTDVLSKYNNERN
ncbi:MAG: 23S rRNA (adenine(2503)-C(2))-methyltransferase RlmN [Nitrosopumilus sp.]|nr:23S rRNA (adenine(2503)-C(2))-methyltransferase RlmN [Nitrosopumilus sp.]